MLLLAIGLQGKAQENKLNYSEAFKLIEVWLDAQKDFENIPSITAMVVKDQNVLWTGSFGYANIENRTPMDTAIACSICSITKSFTAVAIMKLVDSGQLSLETPIKTILPFYKVEATFPGGAPVTVRTLLSHTSGLPGNTNHSYFTGPDFIFPTQQEFRTALVGMAHQAEVGADINYSNVGYALLGEIIEKVSGMPYDTFVMQEIISPLKMNKTFMGSNHNYKTKPRATGYTAINRDRTREVVNLFDTQSMQPAMGLWSSINDMAKFVTWQFRLHDSNSAEILEPATLKQMHRIQSTNKNSKMHWGLGFEIIENRNGDVWVSHGGTCPGFVSLMQLNLNTKIGLAVLINANRAYSFKYLNGIKQILSKVKVEEEQSNGNHLNLEDYVGYYNMNPWNSMVYIATWGNGLVVLQLPENSPKYGMRFFKPIKGDSFQEVKEDGGLGDVYVFERDNAGEVYRYKDGGNYKVKLKE